jgi:hypothetical protein
MLRFAAFERSEIRLETFEVAHVRRQGHVAARRLLRPQASALK